MQHLDAAPASRSAEAREGVVEPLRPEGAAGDEHGRPFGLEPEVLERLGRSAARSSWVISRRSGIPIRRGPGKQVRENVVVTIGRPSGAEPVGETRAGVLLVDDDRDRRRRAAR